MPPNICKGDLELEVVTILPPHRSQNLDAAEESCVPQAVQFGGGPVAVNRGTAVTLGGLRMKKR
jgi:hypothetical protein